MLLNLVVSRVPELKDTVKRVKVGKSNFLTFTLKGDMVPWEDGPFKDAEDNAGKYDKLLEHLKAMKLTVSLGVHQGYLLLAVGDSAQVVEKLKKLRLELEQARILVHGKV